MNPRLRWFGLAGALVYAALALGSGFDRMSASDPAIAARVPGPFQANAARALAGQSIIDKDFKAAEALARRAVARDPVGAGSVSLLGQSLLLQGQLAPARKAYEVADRLGWRDPPTQVYWMIDALQRREYAAAARRLDAVLRQAPLTDQSGPLLTMLESAPAGRIELARRLKLGPSWQESYFRVTADVPRQTAFLRGEVAREMARLDPVHRDCATVAPLLMRLPETSGYAAAHAVWQAQCADQRDTPTIADPGFETTRIAGALTPFAWNFLARGEIDVMRVREEGFDGQAIAVSSTAPGRRLFARQPLVLAPGSYTVSWRAVAGGKPSNAVTVSVACAINGSDPLPARLIDPAKGRFEADFSADAACLPQWLGLSIAPGLAPVTVDDVIVAPRAATPSRADTPR